MKILHVVFLIGAFAALYSVFRPYALLTGGSMGLGVLVLCICSGGVLFSADQDESVGPKYIACSVLPWLLAGLLLANGAADHSQEELHRTVVIDSRYYLRGIDIVNVQSWRSGKSNESLYLKRSQLFVTSGFFLPGDRVTVGVKSGALGMAWISRISDRAGRDMLH
jgi:hypothetical protein